ncbi:hypothetical protein NDN08_006312 [Rhodosorus marinus]|uniref:GOLD domain-containing protein n=1 Tax=Rhodosorus marinus TaxID=101924 RepID=A0AAV8UKG0_9RHOD|nr:hypothetical protein NDN08_006312 [Rhodosorus marinus]
MGEDMAGRSDVILLQSCRTMNRNRSIRLFGLICLTFLVCVCKYSVAISFEVRAGQQECIYEGLKAGEYLKASYSVVESAHVDVDVKVFSPSGRVMFAEEKKSTGGFEFGADGVGVYKVCFALSTVKIGKRRVDFALERDFSEEPIVDMIQKEHLKPVGSALRNVSRLIDAVEFEEARFRQLHQQHRATVLKTQRNLWLLTLLQCLTVVGLTLLQIYYLSSLFMNGKSRARLAV